MGFNPISWITSGVIEGAGKVATDVGKTFFGDKTEAEKHISDEQLAVIKQFSAEFVLNPNRTSWDSFVDGVNRLVRPGLAIGVMACFVWAAADPITFSESMSALSLVPEMLWYMMLTVFGFFFGGRIIENAPKVWKTEPRAMEVAKEIAAERTARAEAKKAEIEAEAAGKIAAAARKEALARAVAARAAERTARAESAKNEDIECEEVKEEPAPDVVDQPDVPTPDDRVKGVMRISESGLRIIREFEGFEDQAYVCPGGALTIGYGHVIKPGEPYDKDYTITKEEALIVLDADCDIAEEAVNQLVKVAISQDQFDALVSFVYNIGIGAFAKSTLLKKLNAGDYANAAEELNRWNRSNGKILDGLISRRKKEARLFAG